ncbi:MAG: hypothetical protein KF894_23895 [Labilithrix sp.]|nr:hypothetical protein [Labilithrix sp.]
MLRAPPRSPEPASEARAEAQRRSAEAGIAARAFGASESAPARGVPRLPSGRPRFGGGSRRALVVGLGVALLLVLAGALSFGPLVRSRVAREAERRKLDIEIGGVRPGFFAISLRDVRVRPRGVAGIEARIDRLNVELGATLAVREVRAKGGGLFLEGEPEDVAERLRDFRRTAGEKAPPSESDRPPTPMSAEDLALSWKIASGGELTGSGIRAAREANAIKLGCAKCGVRHRNLALEVTGADVELAPDGAPRRVTARALSVAHEAPRTEAPRSRPAAASAEPAPPPTPDAQQARRGASAKAPVVRRRRATSPCCRSPICTRSARGSPAPSPRSRLAFPTAAPWRSRASR